ncbi:hypothetical protein R1sor_007317 [Riccia sorocarpa]|uniref:Uncharacterized protein n=1 Tax=Riccia sorocarpa TaxID=122646 RepID=A0ABD3HSB1_9MARC
MFVTEVALQKFWVWIPQVLSLPSFNTLQFTLLLLLKAKFPLSVSAIHKVLCEAHAPSVLPNLICRWQLDTSVLDWAQLSLSIWTSGVHRRDCLFLWRVLARGFFSGSRAAMTGLGSSSLWHQRNSLMFEDKLQTLSVHLPLLCTVEAMLAQYARCGTRKRRLLAKAFLLVLEGWRLSPA